MKKILFLAALMTIYSGLAFGGGPWFVGSWDMESGETQENAKIIDYTFQFDGTFRVDGYPPLRHEGKYKTTKLTDSSAELTVLSQKGDLGDRLKTIVIQLNPGGSTITIDGQGPFRRLKPVPPEKMIKVSPQD